jgi:hypothetical protein
MSSKLWGAEKSNRERGREEERERDRERGREGGHAVFRTTVKREACGGGNGKGYGRNPVMTGIGYLPPPPPESD